MAKVQEWPISELHPTQLTAGMIEVKDKKHHLVKLDAAEQRKFMQENPFPVVQGPKGRVFVTDHHHLGRAALEAGVASAFVDIVADLSALGTDAFWAEMDRRSWVHPLDENGVRHRYAAIPRHLDGLVDDVYRSLARYVRAAGGFDKTPTAFAEFVWADFFRRAIAIEDLRDDFEAAVKAALPLASSERARGLPGFRAAARP